MEYLTKEGIFNDSKPTLKEDEFKQNFQNNLQENIKIDIEDCDYYYYLYCKSI